MFLKIKKKYSQKQDFRSLADENLIFLFKDSRDNKYIGELFERYTHLIFGVCMKYLQDSEKSKDATMDIFENLHLKLIKHNVLNFKSWIHTVTKNHCLMLLRKNKKEVHLIDPILENNHYEFMEIEDIFHPQENNKELKVKKLNTGIKRLKEEQRTCIELLYLQNKSYKEVSEITGYEMKKVKSYIQNGKRNLKIYLEDS